MRPIREWWQALDDQMASRETRTRRSIAVNYPVELYGFVAAAAQARGMSMTAFQRRAALAFAQWDVQLDWEKEMEYEPPVSDYSGRHPIAVAGRFFGPWQITSLSSHQLRPLTDE